MGNSNSTSNENNSNSSGPSADALLAAETKRKTERKAAEDNAAEQSRRNEAQNQALDKKMKEIEQSLKEDGSHANVIAQFAKVIEIEGLDKMDCVKEIVNSMGDGWRDIMKDEKGLAGVLGGGTVDNLKSIRGEYFSLLLDTNVVINGLLEQSRIQKRQVVGLLKIVNKAMTGGEDVLTTGDRLVYDKRTKKLVKWIDQTELIEITKKWKVLMDKLEAQKSFIERKTAEIRKKFKQVSGSFWGRFFMGLGALIVLGGVIVAIVATAGTAAVLIAGGVIAGGAVVAAGGIRLARHVNKQSPAMINRIGAITAMLNRYIKTCKSMQKEISDMRGAQTEMKVNANDILDEDTCELIEEGLVAIGKYLDAYMKQGKVVVSTIEKACQEFINLK